MTTPDLRVLAFTAGTTLLTALVFGVVPALRGSKVAPAVTLEEEAGSVAGGHGHVRLRKALVALQVALATVLLVGAGLFVRTLQNLRNVDLGFKTENVVHFGVRPATVYEEGTEPAGGPRVDRGPGHGHGRQGGRRGQLPRQTLVSLGGALCAASRA